MRATPGVNGLNVAAPPNDSDSVAGTVPPTGALSVARVRRTVTDSLSCDAVRNSWPRYSALTACSPGTRVPGRVTEATPSSR